VQDACRRRQLLCLRQTLYAATVSLQPVARRPAFPGYGIEESPDGRLDWDWALEKLTASHNYWIATTRADGRPHSMPVWGVVVDGTLVFSTGSTSVKGRNLARSPEVV